MQPDGPARRDPTTGLPAKRRKVMGIDLNDLKSGCRLGVLLGGAVLALVLFPASTGPMRGTPTATAAPAVATPARTSTRTADHGAGTPTQDVRWLADRIAGTRDNGDSDFILVDKRAAQLHVFDAEARWVASTAVLLGAARGDESVPGIGSRPMESIRPRERTTPAGRFVGERGRNALGEDVVWVDYDAAVSLHRVRLTTASERRAERLLSPSADDNRISYGCINVPVAFYDHHVGAIFARQQAVIYVLPDVASVQEVFGALADAPSPGAGLASLAAARPAGTHPTPARASP